MCSLLEFFFFKQKTAYEMRISDWSSDVCFSDLLVEADRAAQLLTGEGIAAVWDIVQQHRKVMEGSGARAAKRAAQAGAWMWGEVADGLMRRFKAHPEVARELEALRPEEHTSELQSLIGRSYAVLCLNKKTNVYYIHLQNTDQA